MPRVLLRGFVAFETNFEAEEAVAYRRRRRETAENQSKPHVLLNQNGNA